jgi:hypothetical protein
MPSVQITLFVQVMSWGASRYVVRDLGREGDGDHASEGAVQRAGVVEHGDPVMSTLGTPGTHGAGVTGVHGTGVGTPNAATWRR